MSVIEPIGALVAIAVFGPNASSSARWTHVGREQRRLHRAVRSEPLVVDACNTEMPPGLIDLPNMSAAGS